ncbi:maleylpyruvate isomerase family mycothiol-dependent enzyme [Amycolatopsis sp. SID8362]|uniref:maleylpyruvate isomerase family mycothiol-dependent enzyme n=1 Tax=Amycolatopsis sp. SID8362 TaxID=2690346 RepID=UPI0028167421|nr:maleylpyruvate isomerase family mycothiol-dependent enzyme [Amycolatopsis sp. SID8362]
MSVLPDLVAEGDELDALDAAEPDWSRPTPAAGWTVAHQIAHRAAADANVLTAIRRPEAFDAEPKDADLEAAAGAAESRSVLLERWRAGRAAPAAALGDVPLDHAFPWFGSQVTAVLMVPLRRRETWARGQDVFDAFGAAHPPTGRLRHVAGRRLSFYAAQAPMPAEEFRVELAGPDGELWTWGPEDAAQRVRGSALDFCLRGTHRGRRGRGPVAGHRPRVPVSVTPGRRRSPS